MQATLLLCEAGQAVEGKLYLLGAGTKQLPGGMPFAVAIMLTLDATETSRAHTWRVDLQDADGQPVVLPGNDAGFFLEGNLQIDAPGIEAGDEVAAPLVVNFAPMPLRPGKYTWTLRVDGQTQAAWRVLFAVPAPAPNQP